MWHTYDIGRRTNLFQLEKVNIRSYSSFTKTWSWSMECDALCTGRHLSNFWRFLLSPPSGCKTRSSCFSYPESEENMFLWWTDKFLPDNTAPHFTRQSCVAVSTITASDFTKKKWLFFNYFRVELQISCECLWYERTRPKSVLAITFRNKLFDPVHCTLHNHYYCNFSLFFFLLLLVLCFWLVFFIFFCVILLIAADHYALESMCK